MKYVLIACEESQRVCNAFNLAWGGAVSWKEGRSEILFQLWKEGELGWMI